MYLVTGNRIAYLVERMRTVTSEPDISEIDRIAFPLWNMLVDSLWRDNKIASLFFLQPWFNKQNYQLLRYWAEFSASLRFINMTIYAAFVWLARVSTI